MSQVPTCFACSSALDEDAPFCEECGALVRCKSCRGMLKAQARFCGACGTAASQGAAHEGASTSTKGEDASRTHVPSLDGAVNTFHLHKDGRKLDVEGRFTDDFGHSISGALGFMIAGQMLPAPPRRPKLRVDDGSQLALPLGAAATEQDDAVEGEVSEVPAPARSAISPDLDLLRRVFKFEGEDSSQLKLDETRLKATSQLDFARRVAFLFLYAQELLGQRSVLREALKAFLIRDAVYDANVGRWINKSSDLHREGELVSLRQAGRDQAKKILSELWKDGADGWRPDQAGAGKTSRRKAASAAKSVDGRAPAPPASAGTAKGSAAARGSGGSTGPKRVSADALVQDWNTTWIKLGLVHDAFERLAKRSLCDKFLFSMWAITRVTGNPQQTGSRKQVVAFLYQITGISITEGGSLDETIKKEGSGKIIKVAGGYKLLGEGARYVEEICGVKSPSKAPAPKVEAKQAKPDEAKRKLKDEAA